jgi:hypothetical protein
MGLPDRISVSRSEERTAMGLGIGGILAPKIDAPIKYFVIRWLRTADFRGSTLAGQRISLENSVLDHGYSHDRTTQYGENEPARNPLILFAQLPYMASQTMSRCATEGAGRLETLI